MQSWTSPHDRPLPVIGPRTLIMGVLNVTPDSFSDGGQLQTTDALLTRARDMLAAGADVLDLGGESTRPGAKSVTVQEELDRVVPAVLALRQAFPGTPLSIDTSKPEVADAAIAAGADIINDIWGALGGVDAASRTRWREFVRGGTPAGPIGPSPMADVAARRDCPLILMHNRPERAYADFWSDVLLDLKLSVAVARVAGVRPAQLWLDPGFGFAKTVAQNLEVIRELHRIVELGFPVLVGTSRKSTLGAILGGSPVGARLEAGGATLVWAVQQGARMVRVHDVVEMVRFARAADAIKAGLRHTSG